MHPYEAVTVLDPTLEGDEAIDAQLSRLVDVIVQGGGELVNVDKWGKRKLAYEIDGHTEGYYAVIDFRAPSNLTAELERIMRISGTVIRYLVVRKDT